MFIKVLLRYIIGYIKVAVEGYYIERFINICTQRNIIIWNLKREKGVKLYLNIGIKDFKKLNYVSKKTKCRIKIEAKKGIPFLLHKYKKRKIFFILLLVMMTLIMISSRYIWNIDVQVEDNNQLENIMQDIQKAGLDVGILKKNVNTKEIINKIRLNRDDIAWIGIELKGTNAIVKIVKADFKPEIINEDEYCNIISDKDGIITKINAQNGTSRVREGDVVKENTLLIEGIMEGKYTEPRYVHAEGEIQAKVWHTKSKKIYYKQEKYEKTGEKEIKYKIKINNFEINFNKSLSKFEFYDTINEEKKIKIFSDFYLPILMVKTINQETKKQEIIYNIEEAINQAKNDLKTEIENEINKESNVLRKKH